MGEEKFNLTWHTYTDHLRQMLNDMMSSNELADVTLVSEDKKKFKAHKVVLSASSSLFKNIINDTILSSPIIYLRGIQSFEIESILQFIYLGKAIFYQERMNEFINVAKSLDIKEISKNVEISENEQVDNFEKQEIIHDEELLSTEAIPEHIRKDVFHKQRQLKFNDEYKYPCDQCNYKATDRSNIRRHIKSVHDRVKYPCNQCSYKATVPGSLQQHIKSIHEGIKYPCDECNYKASYPSQLLRHVKSIHEEVKYPCDQCNYTATRLSCLNQHIKSTHAEF